MRLDNVLTVNQFQPKIPKTKQMSPAGLIIFSQFQKPPRSLSWALDL